VRAHHPRRHVRRVTLRPFLGQPEIRQLRRVVLKNEIANLRSDTIRQHLCVSFF